MALENCPAFEEGCPFATEKEMLTWVKENRPESLEKCPAFMEGQCPFKLSKDLNDIKNILNQLPQSHGHGGKQHNAVISLFSALHDSTSNVKNEFGGKEKECPIFSNGGCPFKGQLCSNGVPLIDAIEARSWGFMISKHDHIINQDNSSSNNNNNNNVHQILEKNNENTNNIENEEDNEKNNNNDDETRVVTVEVSKLLKEGTKKAHKAAESVHFVREFIHGRVDRKAYEEMMINLYYIYSAMEQAFDNNGTHPLVAPVHFPDQLHRTSNLEKDLCYLIGPNWREKVNQPSYVAQAYINRIEYLSSNYPELLVPHAYTRYLGDLSGGQVLKKSAIKILSKHYEELNKNNKINNEGKEKEKEEVYNKLNGVQFYTFSLISNMNEFKKMYRSKLDLIGSLTKDMTTQLADQMVAEANYAFELNTALFRELDNFSDFSHDDIVLPNIPSLSMPLKQSNDSTTMEKNSCSTASTTTESADLKHQDTVSPTSTSKAAAAAGCPFASFIKPGTPNPHVKNMPSQSTKSENITPSCPFAASSSSSSSFASSSHHHHESLQGFQPHRDVIIKKESKCPFHNFGLMDVAIVLILTAIMLLAIPSKTNPSI